VIQSQLFIFLVLVVFNAQNTHQVRDCSVLRMTFQSLQFRASFLTILNHRTS